MNLAQRLRRLAELCDAGQISPEEFQTAKQELLGDDRKPRRRPNSMRWLLIAAVGLAVAIGGVNLLDEETISGDEMEQILRSRLAARPGVDVMPETFECPETVEVGDGDTIRCEAQRSSGTVLSVEVFVYQSNGELRFTLDIAE